MRDLQSLLELSAARHSHLCPRQILGVRVALAGVMALDLTVPRVDKRLLAILETDGCFADGVEVATGCTIGHRTLRVEDYGKIAAVFVDVKVGRAVRVAPRTDARAQAEHCVPTERRHYFAQLRGYQLMSDAQLLVVENVRLTTSIEAIVGRPGIRVCCTRCGEEIINERQVLVNGEPMCIHCAHGGYYQTNSKCRNQSSQPIATII